MIAISILAILIISTIILIKYKPAYEVSIAGETVGFVSSKEAMEENVSTFINDTTGNVAFVEVVDMPQYEYKLLSKDQQTSEEDILSTIKNNANITYKTYAISVDGEKKAEVESEEEANNIIANIKQNTQSN